MSASCVPLTLPKHLIVVDDSFQLYYKPSLLISYFILCYRENALSRLRENGESNYLAEDIQRIAKSDHYVSRYKSLGAFYSKLMAYAYS